MVKWLGVVLIVSACGFCGFSMAASWKGLERNLRELLRALELMQCQMEYRLTPLPELCGVLASACRGAVGQVFGAMERVLCQPDAGLVPVCIVEAIHKTPQLPEVCGRTLRRLGETLGQVDLQSQLRGIALEQESVRMELEQLCREQPARLKCCRALGLCCGAALAILLL